MRKKHHLKPGFLHRHLGGRVVLKLVAFAIVGIGLSWPASHFLGPVPGSGLATQEAYRARAGSMDWVLLELDGKHEKVRQLLDLGRDNKGNWSSRAQVEELICHGADVQSSVLINSMSQATLPDGWLSLPGVQTPGQVHASVRMIEQMWDELSVSQILDRRKTNKPCQIHPSWKSQGELGLDDLWGAEQPKDEAWAKARQRLKQSVQEAGLAQLVVSPGLGKSEDMIRLANLIELAGERIALATGMDSARILGLDGRVAMTLLSTDEQDPYAGTAQTRRQAKGAGNPIIDVVAEDNLGVIIHEWFHSLDLGLAPLVLGASHPGMSWLDQRKRLDISVASPSLHRAMKKPLGVYEEMTGLRLAQNKSDTPQYWSNPAEAMAYAFEWWAWANVDEHACQPRESDQGSERPTLGEAACISRAWKETWGKVLPVLLEKDS